MRTQDELEHELHILYHTLGKIQVEQLNILPYELGRLDGKLELLTWILEMEK
jgi:hypothetical protein